MTKSGLPNFVEYALGTNPESRDHHRRASLSVGGRHWTLTYTRPASRTDVTHAVQMSTNLTTWSATGVTHTLVSTANGVETWRATYPAASAPNCFRRLIVTR